MLFPADLYCHSKVLSTRKPELCLLAAVFLPTPGMSDRRCPGCEVKIIRGDLLLSSCAICKRIFHQLCLALTAPGTLSEVSSTPPSTMPIPPLSPTINLASHSATPTSSSQVSAGSELPQLAAPAANQHTPKRRASTPSPSITLLSKVHRASHSAVMDDGEMEQGSRTGTPFLELDADGSFRAAL